MRRSDEPANSPEKRPSAKAFFRIRVRRRNFLRKSKILVDPVRHLPIETEASVLVARPPRCFKKEIPIGNEGAIDSHGSCPLCGVLRGNGPYLGEG
jgi:hypothetical protein